MSFKQFNDVTLYADLPCNDQFLFMNSGSTALCSQWSL